MAVGILLMLIGLIVAAGATARSAAETRVGGWPLRSVAIVLGSVVLFPLRLPQGGLLIAAAALIVVSGMAHPEWSLRASLTSAVVLSPAAAAIFVGVLGLCIPLLPAFVPL